MPIGHFAPNPDGKLCRCGSTTHMTVTSHRCPLSKRWAVPGGDTNAVRLGLYVPRRMWRWYDCEDGERRKYAGEVVVPP